MANQLHTGSGDNVVNKYIINNSLDIESIEAVAKELLLGIALGDYLKVQQAITHYQTISNTTSHVKNFFKLILDYIDFTQNKKNFDIGLLKSEIQSVPSPIFKNIYQSLLIKVTFKTDESKAKEIYDSIKSDSDVYTLAVYYQLFAAKDELINYAAINLLILDDYSLFYLAYGFWRVEEFKEAQKAFRQISFSQSNKMIEFWIIATKFNSIDNIENYSYLSLESYRAIKKLSYEFLSLASDENDLPEIAINTLAEFIKVIFMGNQLSHLYDLAIKFRSQINSFDHTLGEILERISNNVSIEISDDLLYKLKNLQPLTTDEFTNLNGCLIQEKINFETIENWLINTPAIILNDPALNEILRLYLVSFNKFNDKVEENTYRNDLKNFIEDNINIFSQINSVLIRTWCDNLFILNDNFQIIIYQILSNLTLSGDLYVYYLQSLFRIGKLEKLEQELSCLTEEDWNNDLFLLQARYSTNTKDFQKAYEFYDKIIYLADNLYIWNEFLNALIQSNNIDEAKNKITKIPKKLFSANTPGLLEFLIRTAETIDYDIIENLIVELFIKNPHEYSILVTQFHFSILLHAKEDSIINEDKKFKGIHKAVLYRTDGKENLKILVDADLAKHKELVSVKSPLGSLLNSLETNKTGSNFNQNITVIDFIPITYAILRLAKENVSENQHNFANPVFYEFKVTEENAYEDMLEAIRLINSENNANDSLNSFLNSTELPLYPKGKKLESVRSFSEYLSFVYDLLCNKNSNTSLHGQFGSVKEFDEFLVDAFGFTYIAMTNIYKSLINENKTIFVTQETYKIVDSWLKNITRDDFLTVNANDKGLIITNSMSINYFYGELIKSYKQLLKYVKVIPEKIFDLPIIIAEIRDLLDISVFSTLKASLVNNKPWLCIDRTIATLLEYNDELKTTNLLQLIDFDNFKQSFFHFDKMNFEDRISSIGYLAFCELDIYYYHDDIIKLCSDIKNFPIVIKFLENVPTKFESDKFAFSFFIHIIEKLLISVGKLVIINNQSIAKHYLHYSVYAHLKKIHYLPEYSVLIKKLVSVCLNRASKELEGNSFEEKLSRVYIGVAALLYNPEPNLFRYFDQLFFDFVKSQFINTTTINDNINKMVVV